jgi:hypothetical protein
VLVLAGVAGGAFVSWRGSPVLDPSRPPSGRVVPAPAPAAEAERTAIVPPSPTASTATAPISPATTAPAAATPTVPAVRPEAQPPTEGPSVEVPATNASDAVERAPAASPRDAATSSTEAAQSRIRVSVEHPFENARLIVWIDGVLVHETKLEAPVSKRIVAFKVREGRAEKVLDVEPGPHEVRVEVTWEQNRRDSTKVVDVAPGSTGLLEVRVGRVSKDLSLTWSRLARD